MVDGGRVLFALTLSENSYFFLGWLYKQLLLFICILVFSGINNFTLGNKSDMTVLWGYSHSGIFLPGTESLQSPFRTEFSMGSEVENEQLSL